MATTTSSQQRGGPPEAGHKRTGKAVTVYVAALSLGAGIGIGVGIAASGAHTTVKTVTLAGPTVTKTVKIPVPGSTVYKTKTVKVPVPGPTVTKTVQVPAPPPPTGSTLGTWSGSGNENTPAFYAPGTGNYIVKWSYWGNTDNSLGSSMASNFSISATDSNAFSGNLPNDIASSGKGSTETTGVNPHATESFNVQAIGSWTITVVSAP